LADGNRSNQGIKVKLEVIWVGEEFHPGVGVSGWFGEGGGGELVFQEFVKSRAEDFLMHL
jgi:hypothetical protein